MNLKNNPLLADAVSRPSRKWNIRIRVATLWISLLGFWWSSYYGHYDQILIFEMLKLSLSEWSYCYEPDDQLELEDVTWTLSKLNLSGSKRSGSGKVFGSLWDILSTNVIVVWWKGWSWKHICMVISANAIARDRNRSFWNLCRIHFIKMTLVRAGRTFPSIWNIF